MSASQQDSYTLRLPAGAVVVTSIVWLTSLGVGLFFVLRAFGGQRSPAAVSGGGRPESAIPIAVIAIALAGAFLVMMLASWRLRVVIDQLGISQRGLFRRIDIPSERIDRIELSAHRGHKSCVVQSMSGRIRMGLDMRDPRHGATLLQALMQMMPDKLTPELRQLAVAERQTARAGV